MPAKLSDELAAECARVAVLAHEALGLRDLSRSDLIIDAEGTVWFLEVNVAPGLTETSTVPLSVTAAGLDLGELVADLVRSSRRPVTADRPTDRTLRARPHLPADHRHGEGRASRRWACGSSCAGTENVPRTGGALLALNHISYVDFVLGGFAAQPSERLVRFMAKRELFDHPVAGPLMRSLHHISVDRGRRASRRTTRRCATCTDGRGRRDLPRGDDLAELRAQGVQDRCDPDGGGGRRARSSPWCCGAPSA